MDELPNFNIENVCRACFSHDNSRKNLISTDSTFREQLLVMFASLLNVEVESVKTFSTEFCYSCETKIKLSYNFLLQCRETNKKFEEHAKVQQDKLAELANFNANCVSEIRVKENSKIVIKRYSARKVRLEQFSHVEVAEAIKELRKSFLQNIECFKCGFIGSNSRSLSVHIAHVHKELKNRWCVECNKEYDDLTEHLESHENGGFQCRFCKKVFSTKSHLIEHIRSHSVTKRFNCEVCRKSFVSARRLRTHLRVHSNEKPYKCSFCPKAFIQIGLLKNHLKKLHSTYKCNFCARKFDKNQLLEVHLKGHSDLTNFCIDCNVIKDADFEHICAKKGDVEEEVKGNLIESITENILLVAQNFCTVCNKKVRSLPTHIEKIHANSKSDSINGIHIKDENERKYLCTICGKHFKASYKLGIHMRIHTGELPYECSFCSKRMNTRGTLITHERTHTGEKPHICHVCGKSFSQSNVLNTHMKLHTGRTEVCHICNKRFCRRSELKLHMRKHTGEKPYLCTECGQAFVQRSHLVDHSATHSDFRAYKCTYCERAFKQNSTLKSHIQIHLGQRPFKCSQCSYAGRQSHKLTEHMKTHTEDAPNPDCPHICTLCDKGFSTFAMLTSHRERIHCMSTDPVVAVA